MAKKSAREKLAAEKTLKKVTMDKAWAGMQPAIWTGCARPMPRPVYWVTVKN